MTVNACYNCSVGDMETVESVAKSVREPVPQNKVESDKDTPH